MKNLLKSLALLLVFFVAGQGCTDLLDNPQPDTSISQEIALSDEGAVEAIRARMYARLHSFNYTTELMLGPDALADNLTNATGTSRFSGYTSNQVGAGLNSWGTAYNTIQEANLLIHAIEDGVLDQATLDMFRGEAYFMRAFAMHHLTRVLGYEPGQIPASGQGAGWDRGIIVRTEPTLDVADADKRARSTITEVYTQINNDLDQAITLLGSSQSNSRHYIQQAAAYALKARVNLYEGDYAGANANAGNAISNSNAALVTDQAGVANMFDETAGMNPEGIFITLVDPNTEGQGYNSSLNTYTAQAWIAQVPTQDLIDLYDQTNDYRMVWYDACYDEVNDQSRQAECVANTNTDNGVEIQKWNGEKGSYTDDVPLFRVAEMVLIQAEARLNTNATSAQAVARLDDLRAARGLGAYGGALDYDSVLNEILDERRRELVAEGHRFFDLKRLGRDIRKAPGSSTPDVPYEDFRVLDDIGSGELEVNPNLEQNPGYSSN